MKTYITKQGDTFDLMAYDLYGSENYMSLLAAANWPLLDTLIFGSGVAINVPDAPEIVEENAPLWRQ